MGIPPQFARVSGCVSCHSTMLPQVAASVGRNRGLKIDDKMVQFETEATVAVFKTAQAEITHDTDLIPDPPATANDLTEMAAPRRRLPGIPMRPPERTGRP